MKLVYPSINSVFDTENEKINKLVIENQSLLYEICADILGQIKGVEGKTVVSIDNKPVVISKKVELLSDFISFDINKRNLITKLNNAAERIAISPEYYETTMVELAELEKYLIRVINNMLGNISYSKLNVSSLIKSVGLQFSEEYDSLCEEIVDYMELVREYDQDKLFVIVNLRLFITDEECELFYDTVTRKNLHVIMIEGMQNTSLENENTYIVDKDLCEIT